LKEVYCSIRISHKFIIIKRAGESKVDKFDARIIIFVFQEEVFRLQVSIGEFRARRGIQIVPVADSLGMQVSDSREDLSHNFGSLRFGEMLCFGDVMEKFSSVTHSENG